MNSLTEQPENGLIESEPYKPSKRGDVINVGVFDGSNGQSVCWVDYVGDELLYAISGGAKGWGTARSEPRKLSDQEKQRGINRLKDYVFENTRGEE